MSEIALLTLTNSYLTVHRDPKDRESHGLPMPWLSDVERASQVTPEEHEALRAQLMRRSAFRDR